jgi:hypothetical protein
MEGFGPFFCLRSRGNWAREASDLRRPPAAAAAVILLPSGATALPPVDTEPCGRAATREVVGHYLAAFSAGGYEQLDGLLATAPDFQWYSSPPPGRRLGEAARRRSTLLPYLRGRHARHDKLTLRVFHFTGESRHWSNFWIELWRSASDFRHGRRFATSAKGAVACREDKARLIVLSFASPTGS